jgi:hypothetical protein
MVRSTRKRMGPSESETALIWQGLAGTQLTFTQDGPITVIYPGRANGDKGPDFRDAVIKRGPRLMKGDIEVHVRSSDWYSHGHHRDPEYKKTILHVVLWHDCRTVTAVQGGRSIPILCLAQALRQQSQLLPGELPCFGILDRRGKEGLTQALSDAGKRRFRSKAAVFRKAIGSLASREDAGQVLFKGIMRGLGYASNTKPFEDLADRVPLNSIQRADGLSVKQALLLGTAGLLPSQRWPGRDFEDPDVRDLEAIWQSTGKNLPTMQAVEWRLSSVYPNNSPVRRLVALAYLIERYSRNGLLSEMMRLASAACLPRRHDLLEQGLTVAGDSYWQDRFDFGARSRTTACALLGRSKAGELATNVVLPVCFSWGRLIGDIELAGKAIDIYHSYPGLAHNCITRHMAKQLGLEGLARVNACQQQGLIHIFRQYCREGRCSLCPLAV